MHSFLSSAATSYTKPLANINNNLNRKKMKKTITTLIAMIITIGINAQTLEWAKSFGPYNKKQRKKHK